MMRSDSAPRLASILRVAEHVLFLAAGLAFGWYAGVQVSAARAQASWAEELKASPVSERRAVGSPSPPPAHRALIGRLELRRIGVSGIAREGVDARTLRSAIGHVPETALPGDPGNAAFAAHRDTFFRGLGDVRAGDEVLITTPTGSYRYVVRETKVVAPTDLSVLDHTAEPTLTLITCYPFDYIGSAPKRFIVRASIGDAMF